MGNNTGTINYSYFDSDVSNRPASDANSKTTAELQTPTAYGTGASIYKNWDVDVDNNLSIGVDNGQAAGDSGDDDPWDFGTGSDYPVLKVDFDRSGTADVYEFGAQGRVAPPADIDANDDGLIEVSTLEQLNAIRYDLDGDGTPSGSGVSAYEAAFSLLAGQVGSCGNGGTITTCSGYELTVSLDFAGTKWENPSGGTFSGTRVTGGWLPIGDNSTSSDASRFGAIFDGNNNMISNIFIDRSSTNYAGLFGYLGEDAEVRNLGVVGGSVTGGGSFPTGGPLAGSNRGTITACYATGTAEEIESFSSVGGLVGVNGTGGTISSCYATGNATTEGGASTVGGLVGVNSNGGTIIACYATGNAETTGLGSHAGGLAGVSRGTITACYATGDATATATNSNAGGLVGWSDGGTITSCYAIGDATSPGYAGGLVGNEAGTTTVSYFDSDLSSATQGVGNDASVTGLNKTAAELQSPAGYTGIYADWNVDIDNADTDDDLTTGEDDPWDFGTV